MVGESELSLLSSLYKSNCINMNPHKSSFEKTISDRSLKITPFE